MTGIRLEPLAERHLADVAELIRDPDVLRFTRVPDPPPAGFPRDWLAGYESGRHDGTREGFAALDTEGTFLGLALAPSIDLAARELELGYIVAPAARGRGVAAELLRRLTRWAFADLGALRAYLIIQVDNAPSLRVAARSGYVREGVLRSIQLKDGVRTNVELWSRLPSDP